MILVYCSATGFTQQYAQMLHQKTGLPALPIERAERELSPGTAVAFLGWLRAGTIQGLKRAQKRFDVQLVCAVGMAMQYDTVQLARKNGVEAIPFFYLRGGYAPEKLRGVSKAMMAVMERIIRLNAHKDEQGRLMLDAVEHGANWVTEEQLAPVVRQMNTR